MSTISISNISNSIVIIVIVIIAASSSTHTADTQLTHQTTHPLLPKCCLFIPLWIVSFTNHRCLQLSNTYDQNNVNESETSECFVGWRRLVVVWCEAAYPMLSELGLAEAVRKACVMMRMMCWCACAPARVCAHVNAMVVWWWVY